MKKNIALFALVLAFTIQTKAQTITTALTSSVSSTATTTTVTNTGTGYLTVNLNDGYKYVTVQPTLTKVSGTLTSNSNVKLQGSIDGTKFYDIAGDTMTVTNTATIQKAFCKTEQSYKYYRVSYTGVGTMVATLTALVMLVK